FKCRRLPKFRYDRVFFAGDSAHEVSPFGARGANAGVQDADNLAWKLAMVMDGKAPDALLDTYDVERGAAADENILNSSRSTDFITPKSEISRAFRDAVLDLAEHHNFAQPLVNSGRLSIATPYQDSPLNTPDQETFEGHLVPGAPATDAPVRDQHLAQWFMHELSDGFSGLYFGDRDDIPHILEVDGLQVKIVAAGPRGIEDRNGFLVKRYDGTPGTFYLLRPDQRVAMRTREFNADKLRAAVRRALGHGC
ncbi:MAG: FAD-dependent monooxygenase, partial [Rhodospirillales bacterium]|nr:FAD-dependent monooxygenase [Rhodospirillales bacterium]